MSLNKLSEVYADLQQSRVVKERICDDETIAEFQDILNRIIPTSDEEREFEKFIKSAYRRTDKFFEILPPKHRNLTNKYTINHRCIVLLTELRCIVEEFRVKDLIYIKFNQEENKYIVSKVIPKTPSKLRQHFPKKFDKSRNKELEDRFAEEIDQISAGHIRWSDCSFE